jgi:hypothetical protein
MTWHGYVLIEKTANLNQENFDTLRDSFRVLNAVNPTQPAHVMHTRVSLDTSAEVFECQFDPADVEVSRFSQFMADLFGVNVVDVEDTIIETVSYSGLDGVESRRWGFNYPVAGAQRLQVVRFGRGGSWQDSRQECVGYLIANSAAWGE